MMSFCFGQPHGQIDPRQLTSAQLAALKVIAENKVARVKGGWRVPGLPLVSLPTAQRLGALRLVIRRDVAGRPRLEATGTGLNTLAVADQRRRKQA